MFEQNRIPVIVSAVVVSSFTAFAGLFQDFQSPPDAAKPGCSWVNGNVDEKSASADLEAMKRAGFGGLLLLDPRGYDQCVWKPEPKMPFGGPEWRRIVAYSVRECARLGLEFTMNLSDCGGSLKGPWLTGEDGPKRLVCGVNVSEVPTDYECYHDIVTQEVTVPADAVIQEGWRNAGGVTGRWEKDGDTADIVVLKPGTPGGKKVSLRFGYCLIPKREHDVDVIDPAAVERHWGRVTGELFAELGEHVGTTLTHVYSVSWEGAIPTWTATFEEQFRRLAGYDIRPHLPTLAGFVPAESSTVLTDYRRARNMMFKEDFYGTIRRLAHARGLKLYSESGGPWNRDPSVFKEADQLAFLGINDMPQGEFWPVAPSHHTGHGHNRPAANAAHIYGLKRASTEAFTHMDYPWSMWPAKLKRSADEAFVDGVNHFVWHTFSASPDEFGEPGIEYFAGTHINRHVTWFNQAHAFVGYLARCQVMLQAGEPVTDIALYAGKTPYQHWGRYRTVPWDGARVAIPSGYNYDILNDETVAKMKDRYPVYVDASGDSIVWPTLPEPDFEGEFDDIVHRRCADGTEIYFVATSRKGIGSVTFRVRGKVPEIWDPVTGTRRQATEARVQQDGRIKIPFRFPKDGATFVVFRTPTVAAADPAPAADWPKQRKTLSLTAGPWTVQMGEKTFHQLGNWTMSTDPEIRYFSGTACYRTQFDYKEAPADRTLLLGLVAGGLAEVFVNGVDCGIAWCAPFRVKVPEAALKKGRNEIEIRVVNTWRNRLIGDCLLAPEKRHTKSCLEYKTTPHNNVHGAWWHRQITNGYTANDELDACGLYGPVELR